MAIQVGDLVECKLLGEGGFGVVTEVAPSGCAISLGPSPYNYLIDVSSKVLVRWIIAPRWAERRIQHGHPFWLYSNELWVRGHCDE